MNCRARGTNDGAVTRALQGILESAGKGKESPGRGGNGLCWVEKEVKKIGRQRNLLRELRRGERTRESNQELINMKRRKRGRRHRRRKESPMKEFVARVILKTIKGKAAIRAATGEGGKRIATTCHPRSYQVRSDKNT